MKYLLLSLSLLMTTLGLISSVHANPTNQKMLMVIEENSNHVSFYDQDNGRKLGSLQVGSLPHEVTVSEDGKTVYVSNFGIKDYDSGVGTPGASISVIDIPNRVEKYRLYTFDPALHQDYAQIDGAPHGVKLRPYHENQLYVNLEKGGKVIVYDVTKQTMIKKWEVSPNTHNIFFSQDGKTLWLMAGKDGVIRSDAETGKTTGSFVLPTPVRGLKYTPDHRYLMVSAVNQILFLDPDTLTVKKEFTNLGVGAILYSDITPDQKYIVAPAAFDNQVLVIEVDTGKIIKRLVTGLNPVTVMIDESGDFAYITNATDKHITKLDMHTLQETNISTKDGPNGITFVPFSKSPSHQKLTFGVALPLSGKDAPFGRDMMRGYEYWKLNVARAGGLYMNDHVYDVNIVYLDTQSDVNNLVQLTNTLINQYQVNLLLSTYGTIGYNIEKQIAMANHTAITLQQNNNDAWLPNDLSVGKDIFVTTHFYDQQYYAQYNFKASTYSADATAIGIALQKALLETNSLDEESLTKVFEKNKFDIFYQY